MTPKVSVAFWIALVVVVTLAIAIGVPLWVRDFGYIVDWWGQ